MELTGFEPVTPSLRTRCSARLSYSPLREADSTGHPIRHEIGVQFFPVEGVDCTTVPLDCLDFIGFR